MVPGTDYSDKGFFCSYRLATTNSLHMGLRSSTTADQAFQHLKAQPVISNLFSSYKCWELTFETFGEVSQYFAKNCKTYAL